MGNYNEGQNMRHKEVIRVVSSQLGLSRVPDGGEARGASPYDCGRCCLMISLDWRGILSGKRTENSTMRSPRCDGFLGKGRPSPLTRFIVPGLMMSWQGREMTRFSSVGMVTVQPHNA